MSKLLLKSAKLFLKAGQILKVKPVTSGCG